ncbi:MAG: radical SAM protein [Treponema sp.]|jgi:threonylcarbamoyladenosine tRNA methylthiotransferase MtaB|nr:radical SAM protein [Treponema sp.]
MFSIALYTLGCKLNQLESESIADAFRNAGFRVLPWEHETEAAYPGEPVSEPVPRDQGSPHILVINTCTVTSKAEQKARRIIRGALRDHPAAVLMITGCYAQMDPLGIGGLETETAGYACDPARQRLFVLPGDRKSALLDLPGFLIQESGFLLGGPGESRTLLLSQLLSRWVREGPEPVPAGRPEDCRRFRFNPAGFFFHSRAFVKIQDGCDNRCAYCRVSLARGPSVSLEAPKALSALKALEARGYGEAVLTGVNIVQYRHCSKDLAGLLEYLLQETAYIRLRLSSLEPEGISRELVAVLANPRIRPHFHLSVQSGSPLILERMGRGYTPEIIEKGVRLLRSVKDDPFLGCDIIAGFPGETEEAFEASCRLCGQLDFAWIHGFPYSPRPGTGAYTCKEPVPEREARVRVERLAALGNERRQGYIRRWLGRTVEGIVETNNALPLSLAAAVSDNYLKLLLKTPDGDPLKPGSVLQCRILDFTDREGEYSRFDALAAVVRLRENARPGGG